MKTNQFIKEIKSMGFEVEECDFEVTINRDNDFFVARASKRKLGTLDTNSTSFHILGDNTKLKLLDLLIEYEKTPIEDREEEKKNYYFLKGFGEEGYLNWMEGEAFLHDFFHFEVCQTQFTDKEFESLPEDVKSHNWEKIKVERED